MPIPRNKDVDLALLLELVRAGRPMRPGETDAMVTRHFPDLSESDMALTRSDGRTNAFQNSIRWARAHLRVRGLLVEQTGLWQVNTEARSALNEDLVGRGMSQSATTAFISSTQALPDALGRGWSSLVRSRPSVIETANSTQALMAKQPEVAPTRRWASRVVPHVKEGAVPHVHDSQELAQVALSPGDPHDGPAAADLHELALLAVEHALEYENKPIGELLPKLLPWRDQPLPRERLRTRSYRALARAGIKTWGEVAALTPAQLLALRNAGRTTARDIIARCVEQSLSAHLEGEPPREDSDYVSLRVSLRDTAADAWIGDALAALRVFAAWGIRERGARRLESIWQVSPDAGPIPPDLVELGSEFEQIELEQVADPKLLTVTLDDLAERLFAGMNEKQRTVYRRRVIDGMTLASVGRELGLSRERVRQLHQKADKEIAKALGGDLFRPLHWRAADLRVALGTAALSASSSAAPNAANETTRLALQRSLRGASPQAADLLRPLILRLAGPYREQDDWMVLEQVDIREASAVEAMADEFGLISLGDACKFLAGHGVRPEFHEAWFEYSGPFRRNGDRLMVWSGNVASKCVALLASGGEPLSTEELVALVDEGHSVRAVRDRLSEDERIVRINRTDWALSAWGMEEYTSIASEIAQRIDEAGGSIEVGAVVHEIVRQFGVHEHSVLVYAAAPMFVIESDRIRLRRDDEDFVAEGALGDCTGAFRSSEGIISLLVPVDTELLRGSGRSIDGPVAAAIGVRPGHLGAFSHEHGVLKISWPMSAGFGPSLGSVRVLVANAGAIEGDRVRFDFDLRPGHVSAERVPQNLSVFQDVETIRLLTGISVDMDHALVIVADAIGASPANVQPALRGRGDAELADLLPVPKADPQLQATLSDLAGMIAGR